MFTRFAFYLRYALRNLTRSARWTVFAVFCIAAGVATVVALRSLGLAIEDSLIDNVRVSNRGDITYTRSFSGGGFNFGGTQTDDGELFAPDAVERARAGVEARGGTMSAYTIASSLQLTAVDAVSVGRPQFINVLLVDPPTFPPTGPVRALDPAGVPLSDLLSGPDAVVISENLANTQGIAVGDSVRISNTTDVFTVTGIASTDNESSLRNPLAAFFGFAYLNDANAERLQQQTNPTHISIVLPDGTSSEAIEIAEDELRAEIGGSVYATTTPELLEQNAQIADVLGRFIVVMGLGALLIGGVGIINTMLVMVGRRTTEIAALKTFGLKGRQVAILFLCEAFLLGVAGSIVGTVLGVLLSGAVNRYGEAFLQQRIAWRLYPEAIGFGLAVGIVCTMVFGILPVLTANRVRPATILRPNETAIPAAGVFHSILALLLVVFVIGGIAGQILGNVVIGIIGVAVTLVILGILIGLLWIVVWIVGKLPTFGNVDMRLALRNMSARRVRTATTLLALSAGMFALSSITFVGVGTREILAIQLTQNFGGNVIVVPLAGLVSQGLGQGLLNAQLNGIDGITYNTVQTSLTAQLLTINGQVVESPLSGFVDNLPDDAPRRAERAMSQINLPVTIRESNNPNLSSGTIIAGRDLTLEDRGRPVIVMSTGGLLQGVEVPVGATVEMRINGDGPYTLEVIGLAQSSSAFSFGQAYLAPGVVQGNAGFQLNVLQVEDPNLNNVLLRLSENPLVLAFDLSYIDGLLNRLISTFSAIPTVVGLLSLLAAAVTMANTVSLATLERRRQIGVLKAVGLKGRRVLGVMLLENTLIGILGATLGIGLSAIGVGLMTSLSVGVSIPVPREAAPVAIALVIAALVIAWLATFLSARVAVGERVANVLRYE